MIIPAMDMPRYKIKSRFIEHGMFYKDGRVSEGQALAFTRGMPTSQQLLVAIDVPKDSSFNDRIDEVSFALLQTDFGYAFIQIQRRQEFKISTPNPRKKSGTGYNQTRFTLIEGSSIIELLSNGCDIFNGIVVNRDGNYSLDRYEDALGEIPQPDLELTLPENSYIEVIKTPKAIKIIKEIGRLLLEKKQAIVVHDVDEFNLLERLAIVQEVERIVMPLTRKPVTFALDYILNPDSKVDVRFQSSIDPNKSKAHLVRISEKSIDDYFESLTNCLYLNLSNWVGREKIEWQTLIRTLYRDEIAIIFSTEGKNNDAARWLKDVVLPNSDVIRYYQALLEYDEIIPANIKNKYFTNKYILIKNNESVLAEIKRNKNRAYKFLVSIGLSGFRETDFSPTRRACQGSGGCGS